MLERIRQMDDAADRIGELSAEFGLRRSEVRRLVGIAHVPPTISSRKLDLEQIDACLEDYALLRRSVSELADRYDVSRQWVYDLADEAGLPTQRELKRNKRREAVLDADDEGSFDSLSEMAEALGLPRKFVSKVLHEEGRRLKSPFYKWVDPDELFRLYVMEDRSLEELKDHWDLPSKRAVRKALDVHGIPIRPHKSEADGSYEEVRDEWRRTAMREYRCT